MDLEQIFFRIHSRLTLLVASFLSEAGRTFLQVLCLVNAGVVVSVLLFLHLNYVTMATSPSCLSNKMIEAVQGAEVDRPVDLLRVEVRSPWHHLRRELRERLGWRETVADEHIEADGVTSLSESDEPDNPFFKVLRSPVARAFAPAAGPVDGALVYARDRGLLYTSPATMQSLDANVVNISIDCVNGCLGHPWSVILLEMLANYDVPIVNALVHAFNGTGYARSESSGHTFTLGHAIAVEKFSEDLESWALFKLGTLCSSVFLLFAASSLVSFILNETQQRMLRFTISLQHHVRNRLPLAPLIVSHSIESLVFVPIVLGVLFFLFEFFADKLLAFMVLVTVWLSEIYSVVCCRTVGSLRVFPRVFLLVLTWFLLYYFSYPFGFHYVALWAAISGLLCCMYHLWMQYELPALLDGSISASQHRHAQVTSGNFSLTGAGLARLRLIFPQGAYSRHPPRDLLSRNLGANHSHRRAGTDDSIRSGNARRSSRAGSEPVRSLDLPAFGEDRSHQDTYPRAAVHSSPPSPAASATTSRPFPLPRFAERSPPRLRSSRRAFVGSLGDDGD